MARQSKPSEAVQQLIETTPQQRWGLSKKFISKNVVGTRSRRKRGYSPRRNAKSGEHIGMVNQLVRVKSFLKKVLTFLYFSFIMKIVNKVKTRSIKVMPNSKNKSETSTEAASKKQSKNKQKWYQHQIVRGIIGIVVALVTVSVAYCVARVYLGDEDPISRLMIAPAAFGVVIILFAAFWKIFK